MDVIEIALRKTKANISFEYLDKIITDWHDRGFKTVAEVQEYLKQSKQKQENIKDLKKLTNYNNYETRRWPDRLGLESAGRSLCGVPYSAPRRSHILVMVVGNIAALDCRCNNRGNHNSLCSGIHISLSQAQT